MHTPLMYVIPKNEDFMPGYAHPQDAGLDLRLCSEGTLYLEPGKVYKVSTGLRVEIPRNHVGFVTPRSGLACRGVTVINAPGTVDAGYQGPLDVLLINHSSEGVKIEPLDRIAQLVIVPMVQPQVVPVTEFPHPTSRSTSGFGSTGMK